MRLTRRPPQPLIRFFCAPEMHGAIPEPFPASRNVPEWLRKLPSGLDGGPKDFPSGTVKRCMPVLDAITAGYIIPLPGELRVVVNGDDFETAWRKPDLLVQSHSQAQLGEDSGFKPPFLKFISPWTIITPPGYSCLITAPLNDEKLPYRALTGVVDTDTYRNAVNFPFVWRGPNPYDAILPKGSAMVQVIPFRREEWNMSAGPASPEESLRQAQVSNAVQTQNHAYRDLFRVKKRWRKE